MSDTITTIKEMKQLMESFVDEREWSNFHNPKNLSMSISIEASELMELFQWKTIDESQVSMKEGPIRLEAIDEIADILMYCIGFCNKNNIDISKAIKDKMKKNKIKYPKKSFKGRL
tara:strand:- start:338 stop:685 length:348 start_codon:yes stop_codon:yes gene_type:complete